MLARPADRQPRVLVLHRRARARARAPRADLRPARPRPQRARRDAATTSRTMAEDLDALTADLDAPFDLVGHSWGALVALRFALDASRRACAGSSSSRRRCRRRALRDGDRFSSPRDARTTMLDALPAAAAATRSPAAAARPQRLVDVARLPRAATTLAARRSSRRARHPRRRARALALPTLVRLRRPSACRPAGERLARAIPARTCASCRAATTCTSTRAPRSPRGIEEHLDG